MWGRLRIPNWGTITRVHGELLGALTFLLGALIALLKAVTGSTISAIKIPGYKLNLLSPAGQRMRCRIGN